MAKVTDEQLCTEYLQIRGRHSSNAAAHRALAETYRKNVDSVRSRVRRYAKEHGIDLEQHSRPSFPEVETYVYTGEVPPMAIPIFTGEWHLEFDQVVTVGDIHAVTTNRYMMELVYRFGGLMPKGKRHLIICGDANNGDKDSKHAQHLPPISRAQEFDYLARLIDYLLGIYDDIWITPGNHLRNRFIELLEGDLNISQLKRLMTNQPNRVNLSPYDIVHLKTGGVDWVITHQYQYSRNKLIVANKLAQKYQSNVVTFHQHHSAVGRDEHNRYTIIDCGGAHEQDMFGYAMLVPNTMPRMNNGLVYFNRGTGNLITPYATMTDLGLWFPDNAAARTRANAA